MEQVYDGTTYKYAGRCKNIAGQALKILHTTRYLPFLIEYVPAREQVRIVKKCISECIPHYERIHYENQVEENSWSSMFLSSVLVICMHDFCYVPSVCSMQ